MLTVTVRVRALSGCLVVLALAMAILFVSRPATTRAAETKPFELNVFTMTHVDATKEIDLGGGHTIGENTEFVNEPYSYTQAGGHPWGLTTVGEFSDEVTSVLGGSVKITPTQDPKDIVVDLPPGLLADPMAVPRCPIVQVTDTQEPCPVDTQIGYYVLDFGGKQAVGRSSMCNRKLASPLSSRSSSLKNRTC